ncbi:MAG TPA: hypothetical protein VMX36_15260, partial [Sedimentisphaerales bacterium]|nr:hypothetical protein [Sedimentisphaerales bacterium]
LKNQYHFLQGLVVNSGPSDPVKSHFFTLTVGTSTRQHSKSAGVSAAAPAVIGACADNKPIPAIFTQFVVGIANTLATIYAYCGPKKLI